MAYELVDTTQLEEDLTSVADAIRDQTKNGNKLIFPQGYINELKQIEPDPLDVDFVDFDGTLLYTYTATDFLELTELPPNPIRKGLVAQGWNWTLVDAKEYVAEWGALVIGQNYITDDGKTRVYINVKKPMVDLNCVFSLKLYGITSGAGTIFWGDNTTTAITSGTGNKSFTHSYTKAGQYIINIEITSGTFGFGYEGSQGSIIDSPNGNTTTGKVGVAINAVEIGNNIIKFGRQPFHGCSLLKYVTIPTSITGFIGTTTSSDGAAFESVLLKGLVFPKGFQGKNVANIIGTMSSMRYISLPKSTTNFSINGSGTNMCKFTMYFLNATTSTIKFNYTKNMTHFIMPGNYTTLASNTCVSSCIKKIIIPETVTAIQTEAYMYNYFLTEIHVLPTSIPTLVNVRAFNGLNPNCIIYVPYSEDHSILEAYKTATNWSTFANYMQEEPQ